MPLYVKHDLGHCLAGSFVEVTPAQPSNVYVLDERNFGLFLRGRPFRGAGSPAAAGETLRMPVEVDGPLLVVVDLGGRRGTIQASVRKLEAAAIDADVAETLPATLKAEDLLRIGRRSTA